MIDKEDMPAIGMRPVQAFVPDALIASRVGTWESDDAKRCIVGDATTAWLFGHDPGEAALGLPSAAYSDAIVAEDRPRYLIKMRERMRGGGLCVLEYRTQPAPGIIRWVLSRGHYAYDPVRQSMIGRGILFDITEFKRGGLARDRAFFIKPDKEDVETPLDEASRHILAARHAIDQIDGEEQLDLRQAVDILLWAVGRALVRRSIPPND